ncbi:hypothetical protein, partial [Helicobacter sp. 12S02634-8]|uniref:hypothetical protein n=1 Tax=Helicobacter sp. 12S02634-8 TaxID=1476199 RepID=UPI00117B3EFF
MQKEVNIKLIFDTETKALRVTNTNLKELQSGIEKTTRKLSDFKNTIDISAHSLQSLTFGFNVLKGVAGVFTAPIQESIHLNSILEQQKLSLASLVTLNHQNVNSLGHAINASDKW